MEDDVEVELELEKQLSLAHEMFWQQKPAYGQQELLNNFYQRKTNNFGGDEFPKKQSSFSFSPRLAPSFTSQFLEGKYLHSKQNWKHAALTSSKNNTISITKLAIIRAYSIIHEWPCI